MDESQTRISRPPWRRLTISFAIPPLGAATWPVCAPSHAFSPTWTWPRSV